MPCSSSLGAPWGATILWKRGGGFNFQPVNKAPPLPPGGGSDRAQKIDFEFAEAPPPSARGGSYQGKIDFESGKAPLLAEWGGGLGALTCHVRAPREL